MRQIITVSLSVLAGLVLGIILVGSTLRVRAGGTATANGDANGDGTIDVSDAVYTLLYLFKGGEPPVACADTPALVARVQALEVGVARLQHEAGCTPDRRSPDRFINNGDGTVTESLYPARMDAIGRRFYWGWRVRPRGRGVLGRGRCLLPLNQTRGQG